MTLQPLGDHVVVKPLEKEEQTKSGIVIPESTNAERPEQGDVIAVGPGAKNTDGNRVAPDISVGQRIVFKKYSPTEFKLDDETYLILSESDILAVVEK